MALYSKQGKTAPGMKRSGRSLKCSMKSNLFAPRKHIVFGSHPLSLLCYIFVNVMLRVGFEMQLKKNVLSSVRS